MPDFIKHMTCITLTDDKIYNDNNTITNNNRKLKRISEPVRNMTSNMKSFVKQISFPNDPLGKD